VGPQHPKKMEDDKKSKVLPGSLSQELAGHSTSTTKQ
jgi:hypothetical protein